MLLLGLPNFLEQTMLEVNEEIQGQPGPKTNILTLGTVPNPVRFVL